MQKIIINLLGLLVVLLLAIAASSNAGAAAAGAQASAGPQGTGAFQGIFYGWVQGDQGSRAPMVLDLTHQDSAIAATIYLGEGLVIDGGICGTAEVPPGAQSASAQTDPRTPDEFNASTQFEFGGLEIGVDLGSRVAADGDSLTAEASIDLPWFCGANPVISGTLLRYR